MRTLRDQTAKIAAIREAIGEVEELSIIAEMMQVEAKYLDTAFEEAVERYGSLNQYIEVALELSPDQQTLLKSIYLE